MFKQSLWMLLTGLFTLLVAPWTTHAAEKFVLDDKHSYVHWQIKHMGFSDQTGKWYVQGMVYLDKEDPKKSSVNVTIDMDKLVTGLPDLDKHLKSADFFDVARFPTSTFVSKKVQVLNKTSAIVYGTLTLHGISKPVKLMVTLNKVGESPVTHRMTAGFSASTTIKRSEFGINRYLPSLGDDVVIKIGAEASPEKQ